MAVVRIACVRVMWVLFQNVVKMGTSVVAT
jgi:hypothetical protein